MPETKDMMDRDKYKYERTRILDPDTGKARWTSGNADAVALALTTVKKGDLPEVVAANGLGEKLDKHWGKDSTVNDGQRRMLLGNSLRAMVTAGKHVVIGDITVKKLDQKVVLPKAPAPEPRKPPPPPQKKAAAAAPANGTAPAKTPPPSKAQRQAALNAATNSAAVGASAAAQRPPVRAASPPAKSGGKPVAAPAAVAAKPGVAGAGRGVPGRPVPK